MSIREDDIKKSRPTEAAPGRSDGSGPAGLEAADPAARDRESAATGRMRHALAARTCRRSGTTPIVFPYSSLTGDQGCFSELPEIQLPARSARAWLIRSLACGPYTARLE